MPRKQKKANPFEVTYTITCEPEDTPVRGNALASGDPVADKATEDAILADLASGNPWAWCYIKVTASITVSGETFSGSDGLGCCSYKNEAEFKACAYWPDMQAQALDDLKRNLSELAARGEIARAILTRLM